MGQKLGKEKKVPEKVQDHVDTISDPETIKKLQEHTNCSKKKTKIFSEILLFCF